MHAQSCLMLFDPMDYSPLDSSVIGFSRQEYWRCLLYPTPGDLPHLEIRLPSLESPALTSGFFYH